MKLAHSMTGAAALLITLAAGPSRSQPPVEGAPVDVGDLFRKSYRAEAENRPAESLDVMRTIRDRAGDSYFVHVRTGWVAYLAGRYAESEEAYRRAMAAQPKAIEPKLGLTLPLLAGKKWRELARVSKDVISLDPKSNVARARLAHAYYSLGNYPDAGTVYRSLMADYPAELDHQTGLGWSLAKMGRIKEAKQLFTSVLAVSPDNPNAKQGMTL
jgi:tetratricopeptide (TPR) repeat protein